jgi:hypothetical protein
MGTTLYFASQGAGKVIWPVLAASARLLAILGGGTLLTALGAPLWAICALAAFGIALYGSLTTWKVYRVSWRI